MRRSGRRAIFPHLLRELPRSPHIKWALVDSTLQLKPAYSLSFEAIWIGFDYPSGRPCIVAKFELRHLASGAVLFNSWVTEQGAEFGTGAGGPHYCSTRYNYSNARTPDDFYREVAQQTQVLLDDFLDAR